MSDYKKDFKTLNAVTNGKPLAYLDSAATTQKPDVVIDAIKNYYENFNANPHRGAYALSVKATELYEDAREKVRSFTNAKNSKEIIFTKNATEALNLIAYSYGFSYINEGDEIVISIMEHHSNLIPWQRVAQAKKAVLKYLYINDEGIIPESEIKEKITEKTKLVAITQVSNVLGTINPVKEITEYAHSMGAKVVIDASQSVPHMKVDVQELDSDFLVFSAHKMAGPMGIGVLYGKEEILEYMPPFIFGGDMVEYVYQQEATFDVLPHKFEGGTQNVSGAVGLSGAIDYLNSVGFDNIEKIERELTSYALEKLKDLPYIKVFGPKDITKRGGVISFNVEGVHPHDVASILDSYNVAIRAGNHCAQPLMRFMEINSTCRVSFYLYNTKEDVDNFIEGLKNVRKWLGYGA